MRVRENAGRFRGRGRWGFAHRTTNAGCSPSGLSATTRESGPSGARGLLSQSAVSQQPRSVFGSMREKGIGDHLDALIWACCASGKAGIRIGDIVRVCCGLSLAPKSVGLLAFIGSEAPGGSPGLQRDRDGRPGERSIIVASQLHISPYKVEQKMPPPVKHGGEPSIWQKSASSRHFRILCVLTSVHAYACSFLPLVLGTSPQMHSEVCCRICHFSPELSQDDLYFFSFFFV